MKLNGTMKGLGFVSSSANKCLYTKCKAERMEVVILVYMDDMAVAAPQIRDVAWFKSELGRLFQISDLGKLKHILGICVWHDCMSQMIQLDQTAYIQGLLSHHGMDNSTPMAMPAAIKDHLTTALCPSGPTE